MSGLRESRVFMSQEAWDELVERDKEIERLIKEDNTMSEKKEVKPKSKQTSTVADKQKEAKAAMKRHGSKLCEHCDGKGFTRKDGKRIECADCLGLGSIPCKEGEKPWQCVNNRCRAEYAPFDDEVNSGRCSLCGNRVVLKRS